MWLIHFAFLFFSFLSTVDASVVALRQSNLDKLKSYADSVSDPESPTYGQYWSQSKINNLVSPPTEEVKLVTSWLQQNGGTNIVHSGDAIIVDNLNKEFWESTALPLELTSIVEFVEYSVKNTNQKPKLHRRVSQDVDNKYAGREAINALYKMSNQTLNMDTSVGLIAFSGSMGFSEADLLFSERENLEIPNGISHIIGQNQGSDVESQLDVQMASLMANNASVWYWRVDSWLYAFAVEFLAHQEIPEVISMSYGWAEDDQCSVTNCGNLTSEEYVNRVNVEFQKLALRGVTILVSSGDAGAPGRTSESCDNGMNPVLPGSSPWITSVGATFILNNSKNTTWKSPLCQQQGCFTGSEEASISFDHVGWTAGGGFGIYGEDTPYWQKKAVQGYLNSTKLPNQKFNRKGRAYPDVAAIGHACPTFSDQTVESVDGTSCSSPLFAGIITLLNAHQKQRGKPTLGFANPLLYKMAEECPECFNDITRGYNYCTEEMCCSSDYGFTATKGYDPVSGLGTPNVQQMLNWLSKL